MNPVTRLKVFPRHIYICSLNLNLSPSLSLHTGRFLAPLYILLTLMMARPAAAQVVINEIMASNSTGITDEDGDHEDWIELYNTGSDAIDLTGYWLSDKDNEPDRWVFPALSIGPGEFLLVFASNKDRLSGPFLHTNFAISVGGEPILLSDAEGLLIDRYPPTVLTTDNSLGRLTDGAAQLVTFEGGTPGHSNNGQPLLPGLPGPTLSHPQGFYTGSFTLHSDGDTEVRYTLNGSMPTATSPVFPSEGITVSDRTNDPGSIATIPTTPAHPPSEIVWIPPSERVNRGTVIRARKFVDGIPASATTTATYMFAENGRYPELPVAFVVTDSLSLFDYDTGIYVPGITYANDPDGFYWWGNGNFHNRGDEWERAAHFSFFEPDMTEAVAQDVGIRIHGGASRSLPQKSLRIYARSDYGNSDLTHRFFPWKSPDSYKRLVLRNSGQGFLWALVNDGVSYTVMRSLDLEQSAYRPCLVFINGVFWGLHGLRERLDDRYLEYTTGIPRDEILLTDPWTNPDGEANDYLAMIGTVAEMDPHSDGFLDEVSTMMDVDNFIEYNIAKQYLGVYDWPGNNQEIWRRTDGTGRWRWVFFDNDDAFTTGADFDAIGHSTMENGPSWPNPDISTQLLRALLGNDEFRDSYIQRWEQLLENEFLPQRVVHIADSIVSMVSGVMKEHIARWRYPSEINKWYFHAHEIGAFAELRSCMMRQMLIDRFDLDQSYAPSACSQGISQVVRTNEIMTFPNPATDEVHVHVHTDKYSSGLQVRMMDITGAFVAERSVPVSPYSTKVTFPVGHLAPGIYVVNAVNEHGSSSARVMVMGR